ncbi:MAG: vitamin B12-dependent ribonucleotide reductase [Chloroflexi bacterium]|nr:vitamin B12-dependent ribonucleotide reductase [Chloroflexota bacterium]
MGLSDRELTERLADQIAWRLERNADAVKPFPGMEDFVISRQGVKRQSRPVANVRRVVQEILIESGLSEVANALDIQKMPDKHVERSGVVEAPVELIEVGKSAPSPPLAGQKLALTPNAVTVLEKRYLKKDSQGTVMETPEEMFRRVARNIASAELLYDPKADVRARESEFHNVMTSLDFLPNSPTLMNAGRELQQLSACFVLPVEDAMESIFEAVKHTALIHKSGGGTGFSFSRLRPEGDFVASTSGVASGPVSFMRAFDVVTDVTKQGGTRRGANMGILNVSHPDILKFITSKEEGAALNNFNISVGITVDFMQAVENDEEYDLINPRTKAPVGRLKAREVFEKIVDMAWKNGEPGIVFLDRINRDNPTPQLGVIESTNPCGEQPLLPYESCNLGSINLANMVKQKNGKATVDFAKLSRIVKIAVRFLDNVIDMNKFPLKEIEERSKSTRKIGLGVMGFADMLLQLGIPYDSDEALAVGARVMRSIDEAATAASVDLAKERGVFPAFGGSIYDSPNGPRVRNATRTTIAPTGTLSIIASCSSGIEPLFALSYVRTVLEGTKMIEVNPLFEQTARQKGFYSEELMRTLATQGSIRGMENVPEDVQKVFVTAHDITPEWHVRMQAAFQQHTNNAVSKTVNFPHDATPEDVKRVYLLAYKEGCKGITIYRDGSRDQQVLATAAEKAPAPVEISQGLLPRARPTVTHGVTERVATGCGHLYVTINYDERGLCEAFSTLGKAGGCAASQLDAIGRMISLALRSGIEPEAVVKQLKGIRCPSIAWHQGHAVISCADAIAGVLERQLNGDRPSVEPHSLKDVEGPVVNMAGQCPECSSLLVYAEGCLICRSCGFTKCG